jgi:GT2 family glycosyltransferase
MNEPVSIIILNYNGASVIADCLKSVLAQPYRPIEVLVVDNASTDGSEEIARSFGPDVTVVRLDKNLGYAGGNNRGVERAQHDLVLLLNNDTVVEAGWIPTLLKKLNEPGVGAVTSRVVTDGVPDRFYSMNGSINFLGYNIMRVFTDLSDIFFAGGASVMFRMSVVGIPFPDEYFLYQEDVHLSWKLRLAGKKVKMAQESVVRHRGSETTRRQRSAFVTFYQERNRLLNLLLFYRCSTLLRLLPYIVADALAKFLLSITGNGKSLPGLFRAYWWVLTHGGWIATRRRENQSVRLVEDREILTLMSYKVIDGENVAARCANGVSRLYARMMGLRFHE